MITERPLKESDLERLAKEIANDPEHRDWMGVNFFAQPSTKTILYEDEEGTIAVVRLSSVLRLHVQFYDVPKEKIRRFLVTQFPTIASRAKQNGFAEVIFQSFSKPLLWFCHRYLGFKSSEGEQIVWLQPTSVESTVCESTQKSAST